MDAKVCAWGLRRVPNQNWCDGALGCWVIPFCDFQAANFRAERFERATHNGQVEVFQLPIRLRSVPIFALDDDKEVIAGTRNRVSLAIADGVWRNSIDEFEPLADKVAEGKERFEVFVGLPLIPHSPRFRAPVHCRLPERGRLG